MRQLTGIDTAFLSMETRTTVGHVTGVLLLDPSTSPEPFTFDRVRRHLQSKLGELAPFTQKLVEVPFGLDRPYWVDDPDFDLDYHLRYGAVPGGAGPENFSDFVARIHGRPMDRSRPLWESYFIEGLDDGLVAMLTKIHHAAIDGMSGQELLTTLVDVDPAAPVPDDPEPYVPNRDPAADDVMFRALAALALSPLRMARAGITIGRSLPVLGPLVAQALPGDGGATSVSADSAAMGLTAPRTPFNATIGPHRRWAFTSVPLDQIKDIKNAAGVTVNDVVLAVVGSVLRGWLDEHEATPDRSLIAMVPLSVRRPGQENAVGNLVSMTVATLATHVDSLVERLRLVSQGMQRAKSQHQALPAEMLTDLTQVAPPAVTALAARLIASTRLADLVTPPFNVVVSNVPGPTFPFYFAGAKVVGNFPVSAIVDGVGLNVTVQSNNGMLDFGFVADRDLVPDLWNMARSVQTHVDELQAAVKAESS